jgi:hypothetical protein
MQFIQDNEWYRAVRITGPAHNLLGLCFGGASGNDDVVVQSLPTQEKEIDRISGDDVRQHVLDGVADVNRSLGVSYNVTKIQFVPSDSPPVDIYRFLAKSIIERIVRRENFIQSR